MKRPQMPLQTPLQLDYASPLSERDEFWSNQSTAGIASFVLSILASAAILYAMGGLLDDIGLSAAAHPARLVLLAAAVSIAAILLGKHAKALEGHDSTCAQ